MKPSSQIVGIVPELPWLIYCNGAWGCVTPPNDNKFGDVTMLQDNNKTKTIGIWP
jgi:hypothetical protein